MENSLNKVRDFWEQASCGEDALLSENSRSGYLRQSEERYRLEPFIAPFAGFENYRGKRVLEIGVGLGADHQRFAEGGALLTGIDLTDRAVSHVKKRFDLFGLQSDLRTGNAEALEFPDASFDLVYSWGVVHHSPDTATAVGEIFRVLRPGGQAKVMIYNRHSLVGYMLWARYALLAAKPLTPLEQIYSEHLESPGTKAYTAQGARQLFHQFERCEIQTHLTHGDLLSSHAGQRHQGMALNLARKIWPRKLLQVVGKNHGLFMTITATKRQ